MELFITLFQILIMIDLLLIVIAGKLFMQDHRERKKNRELKKHIDWLLEPEDY